MNCALLLMVMAQPLGDPASVVVFGRDQWYQTVKGDEETFTGILERIPGAGRNSRNSICLVMSLDGRNSTREVYVGTDNRALLPFVGGRVRITGMAIDLKVDGRMKYEIWPGKIDLLARGVGGIGGVPIDPGIGGPGIGGPGFIDPARIIASTGWGVPIIGAAIPGTGHVQQVAKNADEAQRLLGKQSIQNLCQAMGVKEIDWRREMLIFVSGGIVRGPGSTVDVQLDRVDRGLVVSWILNKKETVNGTPSHPGKILLVRRNEGIIRFNPPVIPRP